MAPCQLFCSLVCWLYMEEALGVASGCGEVNWIPSDLVKGFAFTVDYASNGY